MLPVDRPDILREGLQALSRFAQKTSVRGRFVALYLGLRRMYKLEEAGGTRLERLGSKSATPSKAIEDFLDSLYTKTHRSEPFVVLTAPFGGSTSPEAPYSTLTGVRAPGLSYPTNTWRNNFGIQKGVGCPAEPDIINRLLDDSQRRLACQHMFVNEKGSHLCRLRNTTYRGEEHSIWMRVAQDGYQITDLDHPAVYTDYLRPHGKAIPIFPLISVLYSFAPAGVYPARNCVGIPDFASDFGFTLEQVEALFDCDPQSQANVRIVSHTDDAALVRSEQRRNPPTAQSSEPLPSMPGIAGLVLPEIAAGASPGPLPLAPPDSVLNTGVGAELLVAQDLIDQGWDVLYRGNQHGIGYDLEAKRDEQTLRLEVKSSVAFTHPELQSSEWDAAQLYQDEFMLAVVDFYGSDEPRIWYVRNPAANTTPAEHNLVVYRLSRADLQPLSTDADFL